MRFVASIDELEYRPAIVVLEAVAALFRHDVHDDAIGVGVGGDAAGRHDHLFDRGGVQLVAVVARAVLHAHAVVGHLGAALAVEAAAARDDVLAGLDLVGAADVADAGHPDGQRGQRAEALGAGRQGVEQFVGDDGLPADVRDVDDRARAGDRDRFLDAADPQSASTFAVNPADRRMPSRLTVEKPYSVKVTVYSPGRSWVMT